MYPSPDALGSLRLERSAFDEYHEAAIGEVHVGSQQGVTIVGVALEVAEAGPGRCEHEAAAVERTVDHLLDGEARDRDAENLDGRDHRSTAYGGAREGHVYGCSGARAR